MTPSPGGRTPSNSPLQATVVGLELHLFDFALISALCQSVYQYTHAYTTPHVTTQHHDGPIQWMCLQPLCPSPCQPVNGRDPVLAWNSPTLGSGTAKDKCVVQGVAGGAFVRSRHVDYLLTVFTDNFDVVIRLPLFSDPGDAKSLDQEPMTGTSC